MIVEVPITFPVTGRKKGNQRVLDYNVWETIEIDIPVVSTEDAPVAVRWNNRFPEELLVDEYSRDEWGHHDPDGFSHTVMYGDFHWEPLNNAHNEWCPVGGTSPPLLVDEMVEGLARHGEMPLIGLTGFDRKARASVEESGNDPFYLFDRAVAHGRERAVLATRERFAKLICVEGRLYRKCEEPFLWLMKGTTVPNRTTAPADTEVALVRVCTGKAPAPQHRVLRFGNRTRWSLAEERDVLNAAGTYNSTSRRREEAGRINGGLGLEVVHQHAFDADAHLRRRIGEMFMDLLKAFNPVPFGKLPMRTTACLVTLDDAYRRIGTEEGLSAFEDAVRDLHAQLSNDRHDQHEHAWKAKEMVELLEGRDVSLALEMERPGAEGP